MHPPEYLGATILRTTSSYTKRNQNRQWSKAFALVLATGAFSTCGILDSSLLFSQEKTQSWTDSTGKKNIEADFVRLNGVSLILRKPDGQEITVPLSKLDDKSRLRARALAKAPPSRPKGAEKDSSDTSSGSSPEDASKSPKEWASETPVVFEENQTAEQFIAVLGQELKKQNVLVFWDLLPSKKQSEAQELVRLASTRIEPRTLDLIKRFRNDLLGALRSKKEFVLNSKAIPIPSEQAEQLETSYDGIVDLLGAALPEDLLTASTLQNSELRDIARKYINNLMAKSEELNRLIPDDSPLKLKAVGREWNFNFQVDSSTQYEAMISAIAPGQTNRVPEKFTFTDGRWLPAELVQSWDSAMASATTGLQSADPKQIHKQIGQALLIVNGVLSSISTAETQQEFDEAIQQLVGLVQMRMSMGGGGPPGGMAQSGFPGEPGFSGAPGAGMPSMPAGPANTPGSGGAARPGRPTRPGMPSSGSGGGSGNSGGGTNSGSSDG
jgi:hypothetical protein